MDDGSSDASVMDGTSALFRKQRGQSAWPEINVERYICASDDGFQEIQHMLCSVERGGENRKRHRQS